MVGAADWAVNTRIHVVGDDALWLAMQARERFGSHGRYLLDLYHVCNYIAAVWPGDKVEVHRHRDALKAGQLNPVLEAIRGRLEPPCVTWKTAPNNSTTPPPSATTCPSVQA